MGVLCSAIGNAITFPFYKRTISKTRIGGKRHVEKIFMLAFVLIARHAEFNPRNDCFRFGKRGRNGIETEIRYRNKLPVHLRKRSPCHP